jgi:predicted nucleic acid-binding protein
VEARDTHHREAAAAFEQVVSRRAALVTTNLVVAELHRLLLYRTGVRAANAVVQRLDGIDRLTIRFPDRSDHEAARVWLDGFPDQRVTYADAVSFAVMKAERCTSAFTFDRHFSVAGFPLWQHVG